MSLVAILDNVGISNLTVGQARCVLLPSFKIAVLVGRLLRRFHQGGMRQVCIALGKSDWKLCAGIYVAKKNAGNRICSPGAGIPSFQNAGHLANPWHGYRTSILEHYNRMWICVRNLRDQIILTVRE